MKKQYAAWALAAAILAMPAVALRAQEKPETVFPYVKKPRTPDWYAHQAKLWREVIDKDHKNAGAWYNYFLASRYMGFDTSIDRAEHDKAMERLMNEMEVAIPNSYEYNLCRWWNGGNTAELFPYLQKAFEMRPDYAELSHHFIPHYELTGDYEQVKLFSRKWFETRDMPESLLSYTYNVLASLDKDAILVTSGDLDTFPIWVLQHGKGIRPDVTVVNAGLISEPAYRARMMKEHEIAGDPTIEDPQEFFKSLAVSNTKRPVYFALSAEPYLSDLVKDDLYTVGLANRYSPKRIDNIALLKKNWESFRLDYLKLDFYADYASYDNVIMGRAAMNYVVPAYLLYEHYMASGERDRAARIRELALAVGRAGGEEDAVRDYFDGVRDGSDEDHRTLDAKSEGKDVEDAWSAQVMVAPNPATTALSVRLPESAEATKLELVDLQGHVLRTLTVSASEATIDLDGIASGSYVLRASAGTHTAVKPVRIVR